MGTWRQLIESRNIDTHESQRLQRPYMQFSKMALRRLPLNLCATGSTIGKVCGASNDLEHSKRKFWIRNDLGLSLVMSTGLSWQYRNQCIVNVKAKQHRTNKDCAYDCNIVWKRKAMQWQTTMGLCRSLHNFRILRTLMQWVHVKHRWRVEANDIWQCVDESVEMNHTWWCLPLTLRLMQAIHRVRSVGLAMDIQRLTLFQCMNALANSNTTQSVQELISENDIVAMGDKSSSHACRGCISPQR